MADGGETRHHHCSWGWKQEWMEKYSRNLFFLLHFFHFSVALRELGERSSSVSLRTLLNLAVSLLIGLYSSSHLHTYIQPIRSHQGLSKTLGTAL